METNKGVKLSETIKLQNPFKLPIVIGSYCYIKVRYKLQKFTNFPDHKKIGSFLHYYFLSVETWAIPSKQFSNYISLHLNIEWGTEWLQLSGKGK